MPRWCNLSYLSAGFVVVLVGYSSSAVIVFQAATVAGATADQINSWFWALGLGMGISSIGLSLYYRQPIVTAWSTPGAALLVVSLSGVSLPDTIGAFIICSLLVTVCGITGWFDHLLRLIPQTLALAMLAGILLRFGFDIFLGLQSQPLLVGGMLAAYLIGRQRLPRYVIPLVLVTGLALAAGQGLLRWDALSWRPAAPVLMPPSFSLTALFGVALPLFVVTMTSQNIAGLATLRANSYNAPASPLIGWTGFTGLMLAPFGGFAFNLSSITAAICMGREVDPDPGRRYLAAVWAGVFYLLAGFFGAAVVGLFVAFPAELVMAIAGLALLGTIGNSLTGALSDEPHREAALLTFIVTASGFTLFGIGSAFWGLLLGLAVHVLNRPLLLRQRA